MSATPILAPPSRLNRLARAYGALHRLVLQLAALLAQELRIRRDMRRLAELDDTMLRDIGIARAEIERAVRIGRSWSGSRHAS